MRILLSFHHLPNLIYFLLDFMSNDGLPIYPAFLGSVCMGHLSAIALVWSISVWFSVGSRCRCLRNRLAEALRWRRVLPPCLSCSMNQMNQQGGQSCAAALHSCTLLERCVRELQDLKSRNKWPWLNFLAALRSNFVHGNANIEDSAMEILVKLLYSNNLFVCFFPL